MSDDAQMAVIGRMVTERRQLRERRAALSEEAERIARELQSLGKKIINANRAYSEHNFIFESEHLALLDAEKISRLLSDIGATEQRLDELNERLEQAGV